MLFKSFREKRKRENEYFERVIEDAKRRECQQILLEESLWGEEWETRKPLQEFSEEELQLLSPISQKAYWAAAGAGLKILSSCSVPGTLLSLREIQYCIISHFLRPARSSP